jgi:Zn-finger protein
MKIQGYSGNAGTNYFPPHVPVEHPPFCLSPFLPLFEEEAGRFGIADERIFIKYITTRYNIYADAM